MVALNSIYGRREKRSRRHRSVEDGRFEGASPRPEKRADIAKKQSVKQRGISPYPAALSPHGEERR
jgi:hypothetical protein